jgi:hypothetical protein
VVVALVSLSLSDIPALSAYRPLMIGLLVLLLFCVHPRVLDWFASGVLRVMGRGPLSTTPSTVDAMTFVGLYTVNWLVFGIAFFLFANAFQPVDWSLMLYLAGAFSGASLVSMLSLVIPSGLGVREGVLILLLVPVMPVGAAVLVSFASRLWFTGVELAWVGIARVARPGLELMRTRPEDASHEG